MRRKLIWAIIILFLVISLYEVVFRTRTVSYTGEDSHWLVKIDSTLTGLNGGYRIEIRYKGKESVHNVYYNIHPHYDGDFLTLNNNGGYTYECSDCGYYDKDAKLLFFIVWRENNRFEEKMAFIELKRISK